MHKNVLAFIFFALHRAAPGSTTPAFPFLHRSGFPVSAPLRLSLSCAASGSPVPATKPAPLPSFLPNFIFLTPLTFSARPKGK